MWSCMSKSKLFTEQTTKNMALCSQSILVCMLLACFGRPRPKGKKRKQEKYKQPLSKYYYYGIVSQSRAKRKLSDFSVDENALYGVDIL